MINIFARIFTYINSFGKFSNIGLLVLRLGIGLTFVFIHGIEKLHAGEKTWIGLGEVMGKLTGLDFPPAVFWGLLATLTELIGGLCFGLGFMFRPVCFMLAGNMLVAAISHFIGGESWGEASQAIEDGCVFLGMLLIGPGKYSIDAAISKFLKVEHKD